VVNNRGYVKRREFQMSSSNLYRWSGLATILGGVLLPLSWVLRFVAGVQRPVSGTLEFVGTILLVFGFMGVYGFQHRETGVLGLLGFVLFTISNCLALGECWLQNGTPTGVAAVLGPLVGITMLLGLVLLGIASWKPNKLPRWTAVLWVVGGLLIVPGFAVQPMLVVIGGVIQGAGFVGAGVKLWTSTN
jgi:hypothetical protein